MGTGRILTKRGFGTGAARGSVPPVCHLLPSRGSWVRNGSTSESGIGLWLETSPDVFICQGSCSTALEAERLTQQTFFLTFWRLEVWDQGLRRATAPWKALRKKPHSWLLVDPWHVWGLLQSSQGVLPPGVSPNFSLFYKDTSHVGLGALSIPIWPHLYLITYICSHPFPK